MGGVYANIHSGKKAGAAARFIDCLEQLREDETDALVRHVEMFMAYRHQNLLRASLEQGVKARDFDTFTPAEQQRLRTCCVTGSRAERIRRDEEEMAILIRCALADALRDGYTNFITGGTWPVDLWAAEQVAELKEFYPNIRLFILAPAVDCEKNWPQEAKDRFYAILKKADAARYLNETNLADAYGKRNAWLVSHSSRLIAVCDGRPCGTQNTVDYAREQGLSVRIVWQARPSASGL